MKFIDEAVILVRAGDGGPGAVSFRHESHVPRGGPDGGNGGRGGKVIVQADDHLSTLIDLKYRREYRAGRGGRGQGKQKDGADGEDVVIRVPAGSVIFDSDSGEQLADLVHSGQQFIAAAGGRGGKGNMFFKSSTNQAPRHAQPGEPGEERRIRIELKLLADIGLVGLPNAGKSTLISRISAARPKIADYPFTTLVPNLGVVRYGSHQSFVAADIPGLIEGASMGAGLGHNFLRHVERTRLLLHLVDCQSDDPLRDAQTVMDELRLYRQDLLDRPQIVLLTKADLVPDPGLLKPKADALKDLGHQVMIVSAVSGYGIDKMVNKAGTMLEKIIDAQDDLH